MLLQASMIYLTDDSVKDFGSAFKKIDKSDVAWSFVEGLNPFKVPGGKAGKAAAVATADLLIYVGEQTLAGEDVSASEAGGEFIRGFLSELAGDQAGKLLSNKKVREKVGALIGEKELNKIVEKVNKNSNASEGHFVLYQIDDGDEILKIGKADAGRTNALGDPVRMKASERAAQKTNPNAKARVIEDLGVIPNTNIK